MQSYFDGRAQILDPNYMISREVLAYLEQNHLVSSRSESGSVEFAVTGSLDTFRRTYARYISIAEDRLHDPFTLTL